MGALHFVHPVEQLRRICRIMFYIEVASRIRAILNRNIRIFLEGDSVFYFSYFTNRIVAFRMVIEIVGAFFVGLAACMSQYLFLDLI